MKSAEYETEVQVRRAHRERAQGLAGRMLGNSFDARIPKGFVVLWVPRAKLGDTLRRDLPERVHGLYVARYAPGGADPRWREWARTYGEAVMAARAERLSRLAQGL